MFRNQYDSDVTVFSPQVGLRRINPQSNIQCFQGRLHQIDYAVEAMRQGSATVAIRGKDHAVVVALMVYLKLTFKTKIDILTACTK